VRLTSDTSVQWGFVADWSLLGICPLSLCAAGLTRVAGACVSCAPGTFKAALSDAACAACPAGTYSTATAATANATCVSCPPATYSNATGASACAACGTGSLSPAGSVSPNACVCGAGFGKA